MQKYTNRSMFSVVIPMYDKEQHIKRALDSVLHQTFNDFEVIVVDDGSTDQGSAIVEGYERVTLIKQENAGVAAARNAGAASASGDWIAFLDADDMWFPNHLDELRKITNSCKDADLIATNYIELKDGSYIAQPEIQTSSIKNIDYFEEAAKRTGIVCSSTAAVKREVFQRSGGFENYTTGEDLRFWARLALRNSVAISDSTTAVYFRGTGGVTEKSAAYDRSNVKKESSEIYTIKDISPACELILQAIRIGDYSVPIQSLTAYTNSRIYSAVKTNILYGNPRDAKKYAKLLQHPMSMRLKIVKRLELVPNVLIGGSVINALLAVRRLVSRIR